MGKWLWNLGAAHLMIMIQFETQATPSCCLYSRPRRSSRAMSSLLDRLKAVQKVSDKSDKPRKAANEYSLEELGRMPVSWGSKGRGKTFLEMWNSDQAWVKWGVAHLHSSSLHDHKLFLHFVALMVERCELTGKQVDLVPDPEDDEDINEMAAELNHLADLLADFQTKFSRLAAKTSGSLQ
eukprot:s4175_g3.t1